MLMRKIIVCSIVLLTMGAFAFGDTCLCLSGDVTLSWGIKGELLDNSANFFDAYGGNGGDQNIAKNEILADPFTDDEGGSLNLEGVASASYADGDTVIVEAQADFNLLEEHDTDDWADVDDDSRGVLYYDKEDDELKLIDRLYTDADDARSYTYIKFPNVVPGILGIGLYPKDKLSTAVTASESKTENPYILVTITPPLGDVASVTAELGLTWDSEKLETEAADATLDGDATGSNNIADADFVNGYALNAAFSIYGKVDVPIGDMGNVYGALGLIIDTKYYGMETDMLKADATEEMSASAATIDIWTAKVSELEDEDWYDKDGILTDPGLVHGYETIPIGLQVGTGLNVGDINVNAELLFQTRLVDGADECDIREVKFEFEEDTTLGIIKDEHYTDADDLSDFAAFDDVDVIVEYAMPMYVGLDVDAEIPVSDMTIKPSANFKMCTDYWKWKIDDDAMAYEGNVTSADFVGRMMSVKVGVDASNIAGMIDASLSFAMGLGDSAQAHGVYNDDGPVRDAAALNGIYDYYIYYTWYNDIEEDYQTRDTAATSETWDASMAYALTYADLLTFARDHLNINEELPWLGADGVEVDPANEGLSMLTGGVEAYEFNLNITLTPPMIDGLTVKNDTALTIDPLASIVTSYDFLAAEEAEEYLDATADWNWHIYPYVSLDAKDMTAASTLTNTTTIEYAIMAGDQTAATLYGIITATNKGFLGELGEKWDTGKYDEDWDLGHQGGGIVPTEQTSVLLIDYEFGVKVTATIE
jgi:hypothetical protein